MSENQQETEYRTKAQRRASKRSRRNKQKVEGGFDFTPADFKALTETQQDAYDAWNEGYNLVLHGTAGTGKTFLALMFAFQQLQKPSNKYRKIYIVRSTVATREMGFLPGKPAEKLKPFEAPYQAICAQIFGRGDAYDVLKMKKVVEFTSTSFIRGITLDDAIIIPDEIQNMNAMELHSIMTRVGTNSRIIFAGDLAQDDLTSVRKKELSGLRAFLSILDRMEDHFDLIEFTAEDIVRHGMIKDYIMIREELGID